MLAAVVVTTYSCTLPFSAVTVMVTGPFEKSSFVPEAGIIVARALIVATISTCVRSVP